METVQSVLNKKSYGPYIINGKQFWRNYHRTINHPCAKTFIEVEYIKLPFNYEKLFKEFNK